MKKIAFILFAVCISVQAYSQTRMEYKVRSLDGINTELSDFGTSYYNDQIVFASAFDSTGKRIWKGNNEPFLDLFVGNIGAKGEIVDHKQFPNRLNTKFHESNAVFTKDNKIVYFSRNNYINGMLTEGKNHVNNIQMYRAEVRENGKWVNITPMPFNNKDYQTGHPVLNEDETKLYFTSDMPGTLGKTDIWVVDIIKKSEDFDDIEFGDPVNLGSNVNSAAKEMFPYITKNNNLYYSSNRSGGYGGLDVYVNNVINGFASKAVLLNEPLNSISDDFSFIVNEDTSTGYFSSNRLGGKGSDDIYYFEQSPVEEVIVEKEPCVQIIDGVVRDKFSGALLPESLVDLYSNNRKIESIFVGSSAEFSFKVPCDDTSYKIVASKEKYTKDNKVAVATVDGTELNLELNIGRKEIRNNRININNIYFDFDESFIREDAQVELEKVVSVMHAYPQMIIESGSHTDSRGSDEYNVALSARRAKATIDFIISRGIDSSRISHRGYGESRLTNRCSNGVKCSDQEHQLNRRTEFVITNPEVFKGTNTIYER